MCESNGTRSVTFKTIDKLNFRDTTLLVQDIQQDIEQGIGGLAQGALEKYCQAGFEILGLQSLN